MMFDNGLVALEPLGWLGLLWLMKLTGLVLISGRDRGGGRRKECIPRASIDPRPDDSLKKENVQINTVSYIPCLTPIGFRPSVHQRLGRSLDPPCILRHNFPNAVIFEKKTAANMIAFKHFLLRPAVIPAAWTSVPQTLKLKLLTVQQFQSLP